MDNSKLTLLLILLLTAVQASAIPCGDIDSSGVYNLDRDINTSTTCFNVLSDGVTLDCQGHSITTYGDNSKALILKGTTTVKNCKIQTTGAGAIALLVQNTNLTAYDNTITTAGPQSPAISAVRSGMQVERNTITTEGEFSHGIELRDADGKVRNNIISTTGEDSQGIHSNENNQAISDNTITTTSNCLCMHATQGCQVENNILHAGEAAKLVKSTLNNFTNNTLNAYLGLMIVSSDSNTFTATKGTAPAGAKLVDSSLNTLINTIVDFEGMLLPISSSGEMNTVGSSQVSGESHFSNSVFENSTIEDGTILDSNISSARISNSTIDPTSAHNCTIKNSDVTDSFLQNCRIINSTISNETVINDSIINNIRLCGNGELDEGEECEDGNRIAGDGCNAYCRTETSTCGNGIVEFNETCDDNNTINGDGCNERCQAEVSVCGNGILEFDEECDDNNTMDYDGCSALCEIEVPVCGNGHLESGEECDDHNTVNGDGCSEQCTLENISCGNGILESGEECDDGNAIAGDGCSASCQLESVACSSYDEIMMNITNASIPGFTMLLERLQFITTGRNVPEDMDSNSDGLLHADASTDEEHAFYAFNSSSKRWSAGYITPENPQWIKVKLGKKVIPSAVDIKIGKNGYRKPHAFTILGKTDTGWKSLLDIKDSTADGNWDRRKTFQFDCEVKCGNGQQDENEECDDNNTINYDGCSETCTVEIPLCGNGHLESEEECDDGNLLGGDGCSPNCTVEPEECGNSIIEGQEECDDGNTNNSDGCSAECSFEKPVRPVLECVLDKNGSYEAFFGYLNENNHTITIPVGGRNKFSPAPENRSQPTEFEAGRTPYYPDAAFSIEFDGSQLVWTLTGPEGSTRTSTASDNPAQACTPICGNGILEAGEECEDGNSLDGDGCSGNCLLEPAICGTYTELMMNITNASIPGFTMLLEKLKFHIPNATVPESMLSNTQGNLTANASTDTEHAFYAFNSSSKRWSAGYITPENPQWISIRLAKPVIPTAVEMWIGKNGYRKPHAFTILGRNNNSWICLLEVTDSTAQPWGAWDRHKKFDFSCEVQCGNGIIDEGEVCDDGNNADGDNCTSTCR